MDLAAPGASPHIGVGWKLLTLAAILIVTNVIAWLCARRHRGDDEPIRHRHRWSGEDLVACDEDQKPEE